MFGDGVWHCRAEDPHGARNQQLLATVARLLRPALGRVLPTCAGHVVLATRPGAQHNAVRVEITRSVRTDLQAGALRDRAAAPPAEGRRDLPCTCVMAYPAPMAASQMFALGPCLAVTAPNSINGAVTRGTDALFGPGHDRAAVGARAACKPGTAPRSIALAPPGDAARIADSSGVSPLSSQLLPFAPMTEDPTPDTLRLPEAEMGLAPCPRRSSGASSPTTPASRASPQASSGTRRSTSAARPWKAAVWSVRLRRSRAGRG